MSNEGARLLAIKFVEKTVLLYTPDLDTPPDPPIEVTEGITYTAFHTPPPPKKKHLPIFWSCAMMVCHL